MIDAAHAAGFDTICATVILTGTRTEAKERARYADIWQKSWDERWTIPNPHTGKPEGQLEALGRDLWIWVCEAIKA